LNFKKLNTPKIATNLQIAQNSVRALTPFVLAIHLAVAVDSLCFSTVPLLKPYTSGQWISAIPEWITRKFAYKFAVVSSLKTTFENVFLTPKILVEENLHFHQPPSTEST